MSNPIVAIGDLRTLVRQAKAAQELLDVVERIGDLEAAEAAALKRRGDADATLAVTNAKLEEANAGLKTAAERYEAMLADGGRALAAARDDAAAIVKGAQETAAQAGRDVAAEIAAARDKAAVEQLSAESKLADVDKQIIERQATLDAINAAIAEAKAKIGA